jgi:uncharacterized cupredoxin-like copper-binding protein
VVDEPEHEVQVNGGQTQTPPPAGTVTVELSDSPFAVVASPESVPPGNVTFAVNNVGAISHNFRLIMTELAADALPTVDDMVDESAVDVVAETPDIDPPDDTNPEPSEQVTADLAPGSYVLICNVATHYDAGMRAAFTVQPGGPPGGEPPPQ